MDSSRGYGNTGMRYGANGGGWGSQQQQHSQPDYFSNHHAAPQWGGGGGGGIGGGFPASPGGALPQHSAFASFPGAALDGGSGAGALGLFQGGSQNAHGVIHPPTAAGSDRVYYKSGGRTEPYVVVSGVVPSSNLSRVAASFRQCGTVVFERVLGGELVLQYGTSQQTSLALAKHHTAVLDGVFVSVRAQQGPPPGVSPQAAESATTPSPAAPFGAGTRRGAGPSSCAGAGGFDSPQGSAGDERGGGGVGRGSGEVPAKVRAPAIPSASLVQVIAPVRKKEVITHKPMGRPHFSLRLFLMKKAPKQPKRREDGVPIAEVCVL